MLASVREQLREVGVEVGEEIGSGTFSTVYAGTLRRESDGPSTAPVAIKLVHDDVRQRRVMREMQFLHRLGGRENCIHLLFPLRLHVGGVAFVTRRVQHTRFLDLVESMTLVGIARYMHSLLRSLAHVHSNGVVHRDVKPRNFLFDVQRGEGWLVDFGLAQDTSEVGAKYRRRDRRPSVESALEQPAAKRSNKSVHFDGIDHPVHPLPSATAAPRKRQLPEQKAERAGTPGYRAPEVLLAYEHQSPAVDMWAAGIIFASLLFRRYPLLEGKDDAVCLQQVDALVGPFQLRRAALQWGKLIARSPLHGLAESSSSSSSSSRYNSMALELFRDPALTAPDDRTVTDKTAMPSEGADFSRLWHCVDKSHKKEDVALARAATALLAQCLDPNPKTRISAEDALKHPFLRAARRREAGGAPWITALT